MLDASFRSIIDTGSDNFKPYDRYGAPVPGMFWLPLSSESGNGEFESFMLRWEAGAESNPHEHMGYEEFLILDGSLLDDDGTTYQSGDFVQMRPGSKHSSKAPSGCLMLVMLRGGKNRGLSAEKLSG